MISKEEMRAMTACELEAYMRGYRDGQVDLREILYTNVIPVTTPTTDIKPTITWSGQWVECRDKTFDVGGDTSGEH